MPLQQSAVDHISTVTSPNYLVTSKKSSGDQADAIRSKDGGWGKSGAGVGWESVNRDVSSSLFTLQDPDSVSLVSKYSETIPGWAECFHSDWNRTYSS